jgi:hypothetical protein
MQTGLADGGEMPLADQAVVLACVDRVLNDVGVISALIAQHNDIKTIDTSLLGRIIKYVVLDFIGPQLANLIDYAFETKDSAPDVALVAEIMGNAQIQLARLNSAHENYHREFASVHPSARPTMNSVVCKSAVSQMKNDLFTTVENEDETELVQDEGTVEHLMEDEGDLESDEEVDEDEGDDEENDLQCDCQVCAKVESYHNHIMPTDIHPFLSLFCNRCEEMFRGADV